MLELLRVLDCEVDFVVRPRRTSAGAKSQASRVSA